MEEKYELIDKNGLVIAKDLSYDDYRFLMQATYGIDIESEEHKSHQVDEDK